MSDSPKPPLVDGEAPPRLPGSRITGLTADAATLPDSALEYQLRAHLSTLYGAGSAAALANRLLQTVGAARGSVESVSVHKPLTQKDQLLIVYGDSILADDVVPLAALKRFADDRLRPAFSGVHVLPFFPFSSDDGFAVVDYTEVREDLGDWSAVQALSEHFELMFDLVINHCSREHLWFADFIGGRSPGKDYFITIDEPDAVDLSAVVRPRNTPLLSQVRTYQGVRHVWTTFSDDQVDLNFGNPDVLYQFVRILMLYVRHGARFVRLDAIAFLWKRIGSRCSSLRETHAVVKVLRLLLQHAGAPVCLLTETNVPHEENISYFGERDEAQLVYQFSLAPLLLYSYLFNDGRDLGRWAQALEPAPAGCSYLNFIASHDGVGMRPLEGLMAEEQVAALVALVRERGGLMSYRKLADGTERVYEINSALFSAFGGSMDDVPAYIGAHQLMLGFQGVPALYLNALVATENDIAGMERTGHTRSINRGQWQIDDLATRLDSVESHHSLVFNTLRHSLMVRREQPAFAPDATQTVVLASADALVLLRTADRGQQHILVIASFSAHRLQLELPPESMAGGGQDLLSGKRYSAATALPLEPYQVLWLELDSHS